MEHSRCPSCERVGDNPNCPDDYHKPAPGMKLWLLYERRPMERRDRKVWIFRYAAMAETSEYAIEMVRKERGGSDAKWTAEEVGDAPYVGLGCHTAEPTNEEREARATLIAAHKERMKGVRHGV